MRARLALMPLLSLLVACEAADAPTFPEFTVNPIDDTGAPDPGTEPELSGVVTIAPRLEFDGRFGLSDDPAKPCTYDTELGFAEVECQLEANELDLYFHGWAYDALVERGTCTYLGIDSYMYQAWELGFGPTLVQYEVDADNNFVADILNSVGGFPFCEFDHSTFDPQAPNCCYGTYQVETFFNGVGTLGPIVNWGGGDIGDCFAGAAFHSNLTELLPDGIPAYIVVDIDETANTATSVEFEGPIERLEFTNVPISNYIDPQDPTPIGYESPLATPEYRVECLDDAFEVQVRFLIDVREWDTVAEFDIEGDPDIGRQAGPGAEIPLENNGSGSPINDLWDWRDFTINEVDWVGFAD